MTDDARAPDGSGARASVDDGAPAIVECGAVPPDAEQRFPAGRDGWRSTFLRLPDGTRVRVVELGDPAAPAVLLVHGWGCSVFGWRETMPALAGSGWRAVAPDLRGHGWSDKPDDERAYTSDAMRDHLIAVMDALDLGRVPVIAHSLGGEVALGVVLHRPERVSRLALIAPVGFGNVVLARLGRLATPRAIVRLLPRLMGRWAVRFALWGASSRRVWPAEVIDEHWAASRDPQFAIAARHLLHGCLWLPRSAEELARVGVPTLVVFGTRDRLVIPRDVRRYVESLPHGRLELIDGAGHVLPEEAHDELNPMLVEFLAEERAGG